MIKCSLSAGKARVAPSPRDSRVARALRLIDAEISGPRLTVGWLASQLGISASRLRQLLHKELGVTPAHYIRGRRLDRAQVLLANSSLSVKQVMAAVGFNDRSHFSRQYKRRFGVAPRQCSDCLARIRAGEVPPCG